MRLGDELDRWDWMADAEAGEPMATASWAAATRGAAPVWRAAGVAITETCVTVYSGDVNPAVSFIVAAPGGFRFWMLPALWCSETTRNHVRAKMAV